MPATGKKWTPQQRRRFMATMKAKSKQAKTKVKAKERSRARETEELPIEEAHIIFAHGHVRGWLDSFAASIGVPERYLARRVGALLSGGKSR